jgi:hypothetical protein
VGAEQLRGIAVELVAPEVHERRQSLTLSREKTLFYLDRPAGDATSWGWLR